MKKWSVKQKTAFWYGTALVGVYVAFRFLLPSIILFLLAYLLAGFLAPYVHWLKKRLHVPKTLGTMLCLMVLCGALGMLIFLLGRQISLQVDNLSDRLPQMWKTFEMQAEMWLDRLEELLHVKPGSISAHWEDLLSKALTRLKEDAMPFLASFGVNVIVGATKLMTGLFVLLFAVILCVNDLDRLWHLRDYSVFSRELAILRKPLSLVGKAYIRTQVFLLLFTMTVLVVGFSLLRNPYAVLLGILIGLLDALPLFGTGTVLIPWALLSLLGGRVLYGIVLVALYLVCYFVREYVETIWMGDILGMSSLETLVSMYVGLKLFSLWGLFLGPVGWLMVREIVKNQENLEKRS